MRPITPLLTGIAMALLVLPASLQADVPKLIGYQGKLTNSSGQAVTGHYNFKFRLYDDPAASSALWEETQSNLEVTNGLYSVLLGTVTPLGSLPFDTQYWLEIEVGTEKLAPRQPLSAAPYAIAAATASWLNNPYWLQLTTGGVTNLHTHSGLAATTALNLNSGNERNVIAYQAGKDSTGFIPNSDAYIGYLLKSNGSGVGAAPSWVYPSTGMITGGTWPINRGGTGATTAEGARTALGLYIGSDVQEWDADLDDLATDGILTGSKVGTGVPAANIASGSLGSGVIASALADGSYQGISVGTATIAKTLATTASGNYPGMTVGTASTANSLATGASGTYENIRAGTATIAMTLSTNANGTYPNMTVGTASSANSLATGATGTYENIRTGTATIALGISTTTISIGSYVNLPNLDTLFDSTTACQGLGFAEIDFTGVKQVIFSVYGYKGYAGGNNDLIWELYREDGTPGTLMQVKDTSNTAGTRYVQGGLSSGIPAGGARVRIRACYDKSPGDAAFLGASLKLIR